MYNTLIKVISIKRRVNNPGIINRGGVGNPVLKQLWVSYVTEQLKVTVNLQTFQGCFFLLT